MEMTAQPISYEQQAGRVDRGTPIERACRHINRHKRPGVRFIAALIGPKARHLRAEVASILHGRTVKASHKEAGYLRVRESLLFAAGIGEQCDAGENADFEREAARYCAGPLPGETK